MAIKVFTAGKFTVEAATVAEQVDATLTITINGGDTSTIGTAWEDVVELGKGWEMSISCNYDPAGTTQAALLTALTTGPATFSAISMYEDASGNYSGSALLTGATVTKAVGQVDKFTASFKGKGALVHTAAS